MKEVKLPSGICFDDQTIAIQNICTEILIVFIGEYKLELKTLGHKFRHLATSLVSAFDQCSPRIAWALCCSIEDRCAYLIIVIFFTLTQFLENKIYTQKTRKLRQNTQ